MGRARGEAVRVAQDTGALAARVLAALVPGASGTSCQLRLVAAEDTVAVRVAELAEVPAADPLRRVLVPPGPEPLVLAAGEAAVLAVPEA